MLRRKSRTVNAGSSGSGPNGAKTPRPADLGDELAGHRIAPVQADPAELADVAEADLAAVGELEDEPDVRVHRRLGRDDEQLAGHLEVDGQRGVAGQVHDDGFARRPTPSTRPTGDGLGERLRRVRPQRCAPTRRARR